VTRTSTVTVDRHLDDADIDRSLRDDVRRGLTADPKWLPPKWFYDDRGSQLFDDITRLDEYYPTRCETEILEQRASQIAAATGACTLVELGSGTSTKTRLLLDAFHSCGQLQRFVPFDCSEATLIDAASTLADTYDGLSVHAVVGDFERHLPLLPAPGADAPRMLVFLGGTIGNLAPPERAKFLAEIGALMEEGEYLLLGTDLVKDRQRLVAAYDDASGVTAEFNRNVLHVINQQLDGDFDVAHFQPVALWDDDESWIEMRLRSTRAQTVTIGSLDLAVEFAAGEEMRTEISAKFSEDGVARELDAAGLTLTHWWTDSHGDFALSLSRR
jgi:L-histidine N-alpha-methyltransferase